MQPGIRLADRFTITAPLGTGPHSRVFDGHDTVRDRPVRIKALDADLSADAQLRARFRQSAEAVAALDLPGVVDVLDCVDHPTGAGTAVCQIAEGVEGVPLSQLLREGRLSVERALTLLTSAAWAVHEAGAAGVRHLNLKPANLIVADRTVTVVDFGYLPTPTVGPYTAVEHRDGSAPGRTADVYALGAIAYECLTGAAPTGPGPAADLPADIPGPVAAFLERALASDPKRRYPSVDTLAAECEQINSTNDVLGALLARETRRTAPIPQVPEPRPAAAPPRSSAVPRHRTDKPRPRRRLALLAMAGLVLVGGVVAALTLLGPAEPADSAAASNDGHHSAPADSSAVDEPGSTSHTPSPSDQDEDTPVDKSGSPDASDESSSGSQSDSPTEPSDTSSSTTAAKVKVPDVRGDSRADAVATLRATDLKATVTKTGEGDYECAVADQNPSDGTMVRKGTTVTITVPMAADAESCPADGGDGGDLNNPSSPVPDAQNAALLGLDEAAYRLWTVGGLVDLVHDRVDAVVGAG